LGIVGYVVVRDLLRGYWTTDGARIENFTLHSRYVHDDLHEIRVVPKEHGDWTLILLHGRGGSPAEMLSQSLLDGLQALGNRAPIVILPDGGDHSYWHNRADGDWGTMVLKEIVPRHGPVAIGGISMGGYGALMLGAQGTFCAIGGHSPALWFQGGDSAPAAFDDADDYARHDIVNHPPHYTAPVWIDVGTDDRFHDTAVYYANEIHAQLHVWPGSHDSGYWHSHMRQYLAFYARHCAH
jgi:S-formylglutathione hydrolase FrmB